jgi:hypothetical protein
MTDDAHALLLRQFDTAWKLAQFHLRGLTTEESLWRPGSAGPHVHPGPDGRWRVDWPEHEGYDLGPPSIAWLTWHVHFWWSMVLDHAFGKAALTREEVQWPGSAEAVRERIERHARRGAGSTRALSSRGAAVGRAHTLAVRVAAVR